MLVTVPSNCQPSLSSILSDLWVPSYNIIPVLGAWFIQHKSRCEGLCCSKIKSLGGAGFWHFSYLFLDVCIKVRFLLPTVVQGFGTAHNSVAVQLGHFWRAAKNKGKLKSQRNIATAVFSHNIISLSGRSKEPLREDPELGTLGKHLQDDCFWQPKEVVAGADGAVLAFGAFKPILRGWSPFQIISTVWSGQTLFPILQIRYPDRPMRKGNELLRSLVRYWGKDKSGLWRRGI